MGVSNRLRLLLRQSGGGVVKPISQCASCGKQREIAARKLCRYCYQRHTLAGTLHLFPRSRRFRRPVTVPSVPGVSYRQLDYWVRQGYLHPEHEGGTGKARIWSDDELAVLRRMADLVQHGVLPSFAARIARGEADLVVPS